MLDVDFSTDESAREHVIREAQGDLRPRSRPHAPPVESGTERALAVLSTLARVRGVVVKGRDGLATFGDHLDDAEVRYLHSVVRRALLRRS